VAADQPHVVAVWRASKRDAYPFLPLEQGYTLEDDTAFFRDHIAPHCRIEVAEVAGRIVGYLALRGCYVDRLYVHPDYQRAGVGTLLLGRARALSPERLELHTHTENFLARAFYEKHGFVPVRFGTSPPPESAPDVEYHWRAG
jgi:ribosomal protein S18 acetylase RimI-like enzyme